MKMMAGSSGDVNFNLLGDGEGLGVRDGRVGGIRVGEIG